MLFVRKAEGAMEQIGSRGHLPIVVGGTGFYLHALAYDTDFTQQPGDAWASEENWSSKRGSWGLRAYTGDWRRSSRIGPCDSQE